MTALRFRADVAFRAGLATFLVAVGAPASGAAVETAPAQRLYIREYRIAGAKLLNAREVGEAVYPFLGPGRTVEDVEGARKAVEERYKEKGFQTVTVEVPEQTGRGGIVVLKVVENKVGRLRVKGSRYFSLEEIKRRAPSIAEGKVPNFNEITRDIVARKVSARDVHGVLADYYAGETFVPVRPLADRKWLERDRFLRADRLVDTNTMELAVYGNDAEEQILAVASLDGGRPGIFGLGVKGAEAAACGSRRPRRLWPISTA